MLLFAMKFALSPFSRLAHPPKTFPFISLADPTLQPLSFHIVTRLVEGAPSCRSFYLRFFRTLFALSSIIATLTKKHREWVPPNESFPKRESSFAGLPSLVYPKAAARSRRPIVPAHSLVTPEPWRRRATLNSFFADLWLALSSPARDDEGSRISDRSLISCGDTDNRLGNLSCANFHLMEGMDGNTAPGALRSLPCLCGSGRAPATRKTLETKERSSIKTVKPGKHHETVCG
jgi:hypothetical protein